MAHENAMEWALGQGAKVEHPPVHRPFECGSCWGPWPCDGAKEALIMIYRKNPARLYAYLAAHMVTAFQAAALKTPDVEPDAQAIWHRFVGWAPAAFATRRKGEESDAASDHS